MAENDEGDVEYEFREDIYVEDVGLTWVTSSWDLPRGLSPEDAERYLPKGGPVEFWLGLAELAVESFDRSHARQLGQDVRRLSESALPDEAIRTVWLGATHGCFDPAEHGMDARTWLRRIEDAWLAAVCRIDPAFVPPPPRPVTERALRQAVLEAIHPVANDLPVCRERLDELSGEIARIAGLLAGGSGDADQAITAFNAMTGHAYGALDFAEYEGSRSLEEFAREAARPARPPVADITRRELAEIVRRLREGSLESDYYLRLLEANVSHPRVGDLVFSPPDGLRDVSEEEIVGEAVQYRPIAL
ncbi:hypothetical protein AB0M39_01420 [Streptomyces sp. NPDC051907]|uniref:hypothetical protein n=1 Tax=Streptomyces sp. NPDC051907 TaxID=3155284 RepID=UPI003430F00C